jgi:glycosyltransferase involved in cell wall biosynthesis
MNIALYAHELTPQIGHSRALIETINKLPTNEISKLYVISFEMTEAKEIFPDFHERVEFIKVPKLYVGPFLIKMLYFFLASWIVTRIKIPAQTKKVGIGIASLCVDYVNVQFVHREWEHFYFKYFKFPIYKYLYKKVLFFFFYLGEKYLYSFKTKTKFSILSQFEADYIRDSFRVPEENIVLNYSGINLDNFNFIEQSKEEVLTHLSSQYPQLSKLDTTKPIYLFVGAFERKGLHIVLDKVREIPDAQLVIVGRPEGATSLTLPKDMNIFYVEFTKEIQKFYHLADCFIFPTIYEPFGLVLAEAACMGLTVYTTRYKVGASELLEELEEIFIFDKPHEIEIKPLDKAMTLADKRKLREQRLARLQEMTWQKTGDKFWNLLNS